MHRQVQPCSSTPCAVRAWGRDRSPPTPARSSPESVARLHRCRPAHRVPRGRTDTHRVAPALAPWTPPARVVPRAAPTCRPLRRAASPPRRSGFVPWWSPAEPSRRHAPLRPRPAAPARDDQPPRPLPAPPWRWRSRNHPWPPHRPCCRLQVRTPSEPARRPASRTNNERPAECGEEWALVSMVAKPALAGSRRRAMARNWCRPDSQRLLSGESGQVWSAGLNRAMAKERAWGHLSAHSTRERSIRASADIPPYKRGPRLGWYGGLPRRVRRIHSESSRASRGDFRQPTVNHKRRCGSHAEMPSKLYLLDNSGGGVRLLCAANEG